MSQPVAFSSAAIRYVRTLYHTLTYVRFVLLWVTGSLGGAHAHKTGQPGAPRQSASPVQLSPFGRSPPNKNRHDALLGRTTRCKERLSGDLCLMFWCHRGALRLCNCTVACQASFLILVRSSVNEASHRPLCLSLQRVCPAQRSVAVGGTLSSGALPADAVVEC